MQHMMEYDDANPESIEKYAQKLIGKTFSEICKEDEKNQRKLVSEVTKRASDYEDKKRKGGLGELIEERFFHYKCNNDSHPDFPKAGVELKVTPYKINKDKSIAAKERLIITMIDYFTVTRESFENSHLWKKARLILLIYYLYKQEIENRLDYRIDYVKLFSPSEQDIEIIKHDYEFIVKKIREGKAHELSESDTLYLVAAPKATNSKVRRRQPFSDELAKPRAFAFKNSYMTYVLNAYIIPEKNVSESIVKDKITGCFEEYIVEKISLYHNYSVNELCRLFQVEKNKAKNLGAKLAYRILEIKGNHAEEFEKANIVVKAIRISKDNTIKESMSFPTFKFNELIKEDWENSTFYTYLNETRFLFIIYKYDENDKLYLKGCQFWNIPYKDLNDEVQKVWRRTKQVLVEGLQITEKNGKNYSNLPKPSENRVCHVRPHGKNATDTDQLPDGRLYPKQCFWLKNNYILSQIDKKFL